MVERESSTEYNWRVKNTRNAVCNLTNLLNLFFWYYFDRWYLKFGHHYLWEKRGWLVSRWHKLREGNKRTWTYQKIIHLWEFAFIQQSDRKATVQRSPWVHDPWKTNIYFHERSVFKNWFVNFLHHEAKTTKYSIVSDCLRGLSLFWRNESKHFLS